MRVVMIGLAIVCALVVLSQVFTTQARPGIVACAMLVGVACWIWISDDRARRRDRDARARERRTH